MDKRKLHFQADRIEWVLQTHRSPARVTGGRVSAQSIEFHISPAPTTKIAQVQALNEEIALALGAPRARVIRENGQIRIQVPREDRRPVNFLGLATQMKRDDDLRRALQVPGTAMLGVGTDGIPLLLRLASPDVTHVLVSGTTGSGKSELVKTIVASIILFQNPRDIQFVVLDPKGSTLSAFAHLPFFLGAIETTIEQAIVRLRWLEIEMERRQQQNIVRPRVVLILDELADWMAQGGREFQVHLTRIVQRGRSAGISVVASTQKPTSAAIGGLLKANFPVRLIGKVTSAEDARVAAGFGGTGAEKLSGRGDFILVACGEKVRFQTAYLTAEDIPTLKEQVAIRNVSQANRLKLNGFVNRFKRLNQIPNSSLLFTNREKEEHIS